MINSMKITKIKYYDLGEHKNPNFLGRCSVVIEDTLMLNNIMILSGNGGDYIVMPSKRRICDDLNKEEEDIFYPVDRRYFSYMRDTVLEGFEICKNNNKYVYRPK